MSDEQRSIELEVEVPGTPEEVWRAIATGPGITSWFVPHTVEGHEGGATTASFGPGPEWQVAGRVTAWDPPRRVVFGATNDQPTMAFEWLVEARDGGSCIVRLVNTGFGTGEEWDDEYDGMAEGWPLFLANLRLHLTHFAGRTATPMLPMADWAGPREATWAALTGALGLPPAPAVGDHVAATAADAPPLAGTVASVGSSSMALLLDQPASGTAFLAVEGKGPQFTVSVWSYLYGDDGAAAAERDDARWRAWLAERAAVPA